MNVIDNNFWRRGVTTPDVTSDGLTVDSTTLVVDETNNRVGIGTSSPSANNIVTISGATPNSKLLLTGGTTQNGLTFGSAGGGNQFYLYSQSGGLAVYDETAGTERARIDSSGNLLVGTTTGSSRLTVSGAEAPVTFTCTSTGGAKTIVNFNQGATFSGYISVNGSSTSYNTSSDYRLKENFAPMTGALAKVAALKPCTYTWKETGENSQGFIAHELAEVVPECVTGEKDAVNEDGTPKYQGIDTSFLVATLTAAIQEQQAIIESLTARVSALEASNV